MNKTKKMQLCMGRHEVSEAVDGAIFPNEVNPLDVQGLELHAMHVLNGVQDLSLYVTGLTVALIATLNACKTMGVKVCLYHFDRDTNSYYKQEVL